MPAAISYRRDYQDMSKLSPEQVDGNKIVQVAFHVENLREAAQHWADTFGAGPFFVHDEIPVSDVKGPDGQPAQYDHGVAVGQWGPVMVELVQSYNFQPAAVSEVMTRPGFNHIAYFSKDPEAEAKRLVEAGAPIIVSMDFGGNPVYFHDGRATHGFVIEHYPYGSLVEMFYNKVAEAAEGWDGSDPVRGPLEF